MKILFLSTWFPYPPDNGSRIRIFNLLKQLSKNHNITLLSFAQDDFEEKNIEPLKKYCREIKTVKGHWFNPKNIKALIGFFSLVPRSLVETYSEEMQNIFDEKVLSEKFDLILCSQFPTILYPLKYDKIPKIFEEIEVSVIKDRFEKEGVRKKLTWWKLKRFIKSVLLKFDGYTVVSVDEKKNISGICQYPVCEIIPNAIDILDYKFCFNNEAKNLIYTGALTYNANFDAMEYFSGKIFALIKKEIPDIKLKILGSTKTVDIKRLKLDENVELTGYVDNIKALVANSAVCIVPLRVGGGTRVKILEAMALGTPVISTSKGAEGIEGIKPVASQESRVTSHCFNIWIEDKPEKFANAVVELIRNREFAGQMALNARKLVEERYDWNKISRKFEVFMQEILEKKRNG